MEPVFVVERAAFFGGAWPQGFVALDHGTAGDLLAEMRRAGFFVSRASAEANPSLKQLIPYCLVTSADMLFVVRRHRHQSEVRLHDFLSIGIGGHIGPQDIVDGELFDTALVRELGEELVVPDLATCRRTFLGLLNDDTTDVGSVHAGLVYVLAIAGTEAAAVRVREITKMTGGFRPLSGTRIDAKRRSGCAAGPAQVVEQDDVWQDPARFESWSRILLEARPWTRVLGIRRAEH